VVLTVNVIAFDVPPPGMAFTTVTEAVPAVLMYDEGTMAATLTTPKRLSTSEGATLSTLPKISVTTP
jgi:hypothetical protein